MEEQVKKPKYTGKVKLMYDIDIKKEYYEFSDALATLRFSAINEDFDEVELEQFAEAIQIYESYINLLERRALYKRYQERGQEAQFPYRRTKEAPQEQVTETLTPEIVSE